jgi:hypothetical protein
MGNQYSRYMGGVSPLTYSTLLVSFETNLIITIIVLTGVMLCDTKYRVVYGSGYAVFS